MTKKAKVLVVEDNPVNFKLLNVFLEEAGYSVLHAEDGQAALEKIHATPDIDVILLDRMMPNMDGLETLKALKRGDFSWHIPVIMLTAALSAEQISYAIVQGAYGCLPKPYNKEKIVTIIRQALEDAAKEKAKR